MEAALTKYLKQETNTAVAGRVFLSQAPEIAEPPYIVIQRISTPRTYSFSSTQVLAEPRVQVSCWGKSYGEACGVADAVHAALQLKSGALTDSFSVLLIMAIGESDDVDGGWFRRRLDYRITYVE